MTKKKDYLRPFLIGECEPQWEMAFLASQLLEVESTGHEVIDYPDDPDTGESYFDDNWN